MSDNQNVEAGRCLNCGQPTDSGHDDAVDCRNALLKLLVKIEWGGSCMSYGSNCPCCHAFPLEQEPHEEDCDLAAGVRATGQSSDPSR